MHSTAKVHKLRWVQGEGGIKEDGELGLCCQADLLNVTKLKEYMQPNCTLKLGPSTNCK